MYGQLPREWSPLSDVSVVRWSTAAEAEAITPIFALRSRMAPLFVLAFRLARWGRRPQGR
jgi:hypothetical protein